MSLPVEGKLLFTAIVIAIHYWFARSCFDDMKWGSVIYPHFKWLYHGLYWISFWFGTVIVVGLVCLVWWR